MRVAALLVAGARPNFMKLAPVYRALTDRPRFHPTIVHTGQHYDPELSDVFFRDLGLPAPGISLGVGSGSHGAQTARILERFEQVLLEREPQLVVVLGDINSTVACALAAAKVVYRSGRRPRVAHVEAGLRSFDRTMPEEINRLLTDAIADFLFTTEESANANLIREGVAPTKIFFVGNVMIDTLLAQSEGARRLEIWERFGLEQRAYAVATLHRPSNVDDSETLRGILDTLCRIGARLPVVFPAHPRTTGRMEQARIDAERLQASGLRVIPPLGYTEFLSLMSGARVVLTDSGGIQEEATILGIPCLTLRENTERPITVTHGTNTLVGTDRAAILSAVDRTLDGPARPHRVPPLWDGKAAERIAEVLDRHPWSAHQAS